MSPQSLHHPSAALHTAPIAPAHLAQHTAFRADHGGHRRQEQAKLPHGVHHCEEQSLRQLELGACSKPGFSLHSSGDRNLAVLIPTSPKPFKALARDQLGNVSNSCRASCPREHVPGAATLEVCLAIGNSSSQNDTASRGCLDLSSASAVAFGSVGLAPETTRLRRGGYGFGAARQASEPFGHPNCYWRGWCISFQVRHRLLYKTKRAIWEFGILAYLHKAPSQPHALTRNSGCRRQRCHRRARSHRRSRCTS